MRPCLVAVALVLSNIALAGKPTPEQRAWYTHTLEAGPAEKHAIPAPLQVDAMPWAVGQWVLWEITDKKGRKSLEQMAVVRKDECGWWLETVTQDKKHRTSTKICYTDQLRVFSDLETTTSNALELAQMIITSTDGGTPSVIDYRTPEGAMMKQMGGQMLTQSFPMWELDASTKQTVEVPGGSFTDAVKVDFAVKLAFIKLSGTGFAHTSVPITGTVRVETSDQRVKELVDFGLEGAVSDTPKVWGPLDI